jgi:LCP family protein required for cell wall assembly
MTKEEMDTATLADESKLSKKEQKKADKAAKKAAKKKKKHIGRWIVGILLLLIVVGIGRFVWGINSAMDGKKAPVENFNGVKSANGASNILILGTDQRKTQTEGSARSDAIMVLQLDGPSKKPKLISFMRDTLVHIPGVGTPGYTDSKINNAYTIGEQNDNQGAELVRETLKDNFGIDTKYYAEVNFNSFANVIDGLFPNGVEIDAKFSTINGKKVKSVKVPDDLNKKPGHKTPKQTIKVGEQRMDGRTLLNYSRFRHDDENDFGRVKRQQQVMTAIMQQVKSPTTLFTAPYAIGQVVGNTSTNITNSYILANVFTVLFGASDGLQKMTIPTGDKYTPATDMYGGAGLDVDLPYYQKKINKFFDQ